MAFLSFIFSLFLFLFLCALLFLPLLLRFAIRLLWSATYFPQLVKMTYRDWNQRVSFVCAQFRWYRLTDLLTFVDDLRRCILESIGKISEVRCPPLEPLGEPPAQPHLRFPESDTFVCDGVGDWADRIDALLLARSLILYPNKLLRRYPDILTQGEAELYALHLINQFMRDVVR